MGLFLEISRLFCWVYYPPAQISEEEDHKTQEKDFRTSEGDEVQEERMDTEALLQDRCLTGTCKSDAR